MERLAYYCILIALDQLEARGDRPHGKIVVFDSQVKSPVYIPEAIVWDEKDDVTTTTQMVLHLPLSMASEYAAGKLQLSSDPTVTAAASPLSTQTVALPVIPTAMPSVDSVTHKVSPDDGVGSVGGVLSNGASVNSSTWPGVSYAPYRADHQCKLQSDIMDDMKEMAGKYSVIRIYGTDCDQVPMMYKAAKVAGNVKLFLGIWDLSAIVPECEKIIAGVNGDWTIVHTISVGNEPVSKGEASPETMVRAVKSARAILRAAGYEGPVVTVDTFAAVKKYPELCNESDYCAVNAHPFFDRTTTAKQAGEWLVNTIHDVKSQLASSSQQVVITETGWPTGGSSNGAAVPGLKNQKMALDSIRNAFSEKPSDIIFLSAFNDLWKTKTAETFYAEPYWGIDGAVANCDR